MSYTYIYSGNDEATPDSAVKVRGIFEASGALYVPVGVQTGTVHDRLIWYKSANLGATFSDLGHSDTYMGLEPSYLRLTGTDIYYPSWMPGDVYGDGNASHFASASDTIVDDTSVVEDTLLYPFVFKLSNGTIRVITRQFTYNLNTYYAFLDYTGGAWTSLTEIDSFADRSVYILGPPILDGNDVLHLFCWNYKFGEVASIFHKSIAQNGTVSDRTIIWQGTEVGEFPPVTWRDGVYNAAYDQFDMVGIDNAGHVCYTRIDRADPTDFTSIVLNDLEYESSSDVRISNSSDGEYSYLYAWSSDEHARNDVRIRFKKLTQATDTWGDVEIPYDSSIDPPPAYPLGPEGDNLYLETVYLTKRSDGELSMAFGLAETLAYGSTSYLYHYSGLDDSRLQVLVTDDADSLVDGILLGIGCLLEDSLSLSDTLSTWLQPGLAPLAVAVADYMWLTSAVVSPRLSIGSRIVRSVIESCDLLVASEYCTGFKTYRDNTLEEVEDWASRLDIYEVGAETCS